jgi:phage-related protein
MADGKVVINSEIDDDGVSRGIKNIKDKLQNLNSSLIRTAALGAAIQIAPAVVPAIAAATGAAMGLASSFAAAGIGVAAFGAVAVSTLGKVFEASEEVAKLEEKIAKADSAKERIAAQKELAALYEGMSEAQRNALKELQSFKKFWTDFTKQFETPVFEAFGTSLALLKNVLTGLAPTIDAVSAVVVELLQEMNNAVIVGKLQGFFEWLEINAAESLYNFAHIAGNVFAGFFNLLQAFAPLGASMEEGLLRLTQRFEDWTSGLAGAEAFEEFINYVKENGPKLLSILGNLGTIIIAVGKALAPFGSIVLDVLNSVTGFIAKLLEGNPALAATGAAIALFAGKLMALAPIITTIVGWVSSFIGWLIPLFQKVDGTAKGITMLRTAFAALTGPVGLIIAAIAGLVAIFVGLRKTNEEFRNKVTEIWTAIQTAIGTAISAVSAFIMEIWGQVVTFWKENQDSILAAAQNVWSVIGTVINTALTVIMTLFQVLWPIIKAIVVDTWGAIQNVIQGAVNVILGIIKFFSALFTGDWQGLWDATKQILSGAIELLWGLLQLGFLGKILKVIKTFGKNAVDKFMEMVNGAKGKFDDLVSSAKAKFDDIKEKIMNPIQEAKDFVKEQIDKIKEFFDNLKLKIPKPKLPKFSISGKFSLNPPSVPHINFDGWKKDGALFPANSPRLIGIGDNKRYKEAALPLSPKVLGMIGRKIADTMPEGSRGAYENLPPIIVQSILNGRIIAEETVEPMSYLLRQRMNPRRV